MEGKRFIHRLTLKNLLSFGPEGIDFELEPLNVLIGPNASGKSNFIEAISLLQAAPTNIARAISDGGGIWEWLWKGPGALSGLEIEAVVAFEPGSRLLGHRISLAARHTTTGWRTRRGTEVVGNWSPQGGMTPPIAYDSDVPDGPDVPEDESVLSQLRDAENHPEITYLGRMYGRIQLYREWIMGRAAAPKEFQRADLPADAVLPDASNLALVLNALDSLPEHGKCVLHELRRFHPRAEKLSVFVGGGRVQLLLHEEGVERPIPATRLSDGTLHYLFLLAILHQPSPPPLVCIEEPELGLHPDVMRDVARLLVDASARTQLIVTTHSDALVSALTTTAESVVVCEREPEGTQLRRLEAERLRKWLDEYTLGDLWAMGELGGTLK